MVILHPVLAGQLSSAINSRSVASDMIDTVLKTEPFDKEKFNYWAKAHIEHSNKLRSMGIEVVTYNETTL
jgi:hypothetical protein